MYIHINVLSCCLLCPLQKLQDGYYGFEGENVQEFFFRLAALAFEDAILKDLETEISTTQIGDGSILGKRLHSEIIKQRCSLM